ncbi:protein of unknown function [Magnetospirillum sp. XM-1]|nr:protein of unknown function [Magnetospirillum sp. XM-1]
MLTKKLDLVYVGIQYRLSRTLANHGLAISNTDNSLLSSVQDQDACGVMTK